MSSELPVHFPQLLSHFFSFPGNPFWSSCFSLPRKSCLPKEVNQVPISLLPCTSKWSRIHWRRISRSEAREEKQTLMKPSVRQFFSTFPPPLFLLHDQLYPLKNNWALKVLRDHELKIVNSFNADLRRNVCYLSQTHYSSTSTHPSAITRQDKSILRYLPPLIHS